MRTFLCAALVAACIGCTGENSGGLLNEGQQQGGYIAPNTLLIDPHTERVYAVKGVAGAASSVDFPVANVFTTGCDGGLGIDGAALVPDHGIDAGAVGPTHDEVWSIDPDTGTRRHIGDVGGDESVKLYFVESRLLYDSFTSRGAELRLQDPGTLAFTASARIEVFGSETYDALSPDERFFASWGVGGFRNVALPDGGTIGRAGGSMSLVDTRTLETHVTACTFSRPAWLHSGDRFVVVDSVSSATGADTTRLREFSVANLQASNFAVAPDGSWTGSLLDVPLDALGSVSISPDDRFAAVDATDGIQIVELATGTTRRVPGIRGPVIFTPNSSTVIGFDGGTGPTGPDAAGPPVRILLVDVASGAITPVTTDFASSPYFFLASDGHRLVIFSTSGASQGHIAVADLTMGAMSATPVAGTGPGEFGGIIDRRGHDELWILDLHMHLLRRVDLAAGTIDLVTTDFVPASMAYLPTRDLIAFSEADAAAVRFWNPSTRSTVRRVPY